MRHGNLEKAGKRIWMFRWNLEQNTPPFSRCIGQGHRLQGLVKTPSKLPSSVPWNWGRACRLGFWVEGFCASYEQIWKICIYISLDTWIHFKWISKSNQFLPPRFLLEALMSAINVELGKVRSSKQKAGAQCNMEPTCLRPFSLESVVFPFCIQCVWILPVNGKCFLQSHKTSPLQRLLMWRLHLFRCFSSPQILHAVFLTPPKSTRSDISLGT